MKIPLFQQKVSVTIEGKTREISFKDVMKIAKKTEVFFSVDRNLRIIMRCPDRPKERKMMATLRRWLTASPELEGLMLLNFCQYNVNKAADGIAAAIRDLFEERIAIKESNDVECTLISCATEHCSTTPPGKDMLAS